jgi:hypothetical protein
MRFRTISRIFGTYFKKYGILFSWDTQEYPQGYPAISSGLRRNILSVTQTVPQGYPAMLRLKRSLLSSCIFAFEQKANIILSG